MITTTVKADKNEQPGKLPKGSRNDIHKRDKNN